MYLLLSYLIPLTVKAVLHTVKLLTLKRNNFRSTKNSTRKMQVVVIMVVMAFFLLLLLWHVLTMSYEFRLFTPGYILSSLLVLCCFSLTTVLTLFSMRSCPRELREVYASVSFGEKVKKMKNP